MDNLIRLNNHIKNFGVSKNSDPMDEIIAKIAKAKVIVTNTYHGTYWASLLGKKVYTVETTTKTKSTPRAFCCPLIAESRKTCLVSNSSTSSCWRIKQCVKTNCSTEIT